MLEVDKYLYQHIESEDIVMQNITSFASSLYNWPQILRNYLQNWSLLDFHLNHALTSWYLKWALSSRYVFVHFSLKYLNHLYHQFILADIHCTNTHVHGYSSQAWQVQLYHEGNEIMKPEAWSLGSWTLLTTFYSYFPSCLKSHVHLWPTISMWFSLSALDFRLANTCTVYLVVEKKCK